MELSRSEDFISFRINENVVSGSGVITKSACGQITYDEYEWPVFEENATKASLKHSFADGDTVGLFGFNTAAEKITDVATPELFYNRPFVISGGSDLISDEKTAWKDCQKPYVRFYGYYPFGKFTLTDSTFTDVPRILNYCVPDNITEQCDILIGKTDYLSSSSRPDVVLDFRHALTAIQFRIGFACTVKKVSIKNVYSTGDVRLSYYEDKWLGLNDPKSYSIDFGAGKLISASGEYLTGDSLSMMMIPQSFDAKSKAKIELIYNDGAVDDTISGSLASTSWTAGKKIVYTLNKSGAVPEENYIYFDLYAGNVILTDTTYNGFVYVDGVATKVHGTHNASNKYYVFQSVNDSSVLTKTGGDNVFSAHCGYASQADFEAGKNCRIPDYGAQYVTLDSKNMLWEEGIINHPLPVSLCDGWRNNALNYSTTNMILIRGHKTDATPFDVTIDHIWSRHFPYMKAHPDGTPISSTGCDKYGGITIGEDRPDMSYSSSKIKFRNYYTEQVTLRLKSNSVLYRLNYCKPIDSGKPGYLKITSADGDKVNKGSLSLFFPPKTEDDYFADGRCGLIGSGNRNDKDRLPGDQGYTERQLDNFSLEGGILCVQMRKFKESKWDDNKYLMSCFGSTNSQCNITINGGTITALSNSTGAAIGGGAGWVDNGGKGVVTINGGNVYAYNYGVKSNSYGTIPSTAIGGGSSSGKNDEGIGAEGTVVINGGNVYAYSIGGTAIGAGSSARHMGGMASVTITGGVINAVSGADKIGGTQVTQSTAIGGGRAGYEDGNGGDATVTVSGGTLKAGSVGGGKCDNSSGKIGSANILVSDGVTSAQFIMARGATTDPTFLMTGGTISNSSTFDTEYTKVQKHGGAVYMESGTCTISGGTIEKCSADTAGAVYMNGGTFTMTGGEISNCSASTHGGAVYVDGGNAFINGGTIQKNLASKGNGGGVYVSAGNFKMDTMSTAKINNNSADAYNNKFGNGGGIYVRSTTKNVKVDIIGGEVQYNAADRNGGGLCVDMEGSSYTATIKIGKENGQYDKPKIAANSAALSGGGMAVQGSGSNIYIYSGTVKGNVSAYVQNEDIRNDGGMVDLVGKNSPGKVDHVDVNYKTITFYANNGYDPEPYDEQRVITSTNSPLTPTATALAFEKEFYKKVSWNTKRDGSGVTYDLNGTDEVMNITSDLSLYAQWVENR